MKGDFIMNKEVINKYQREKRTQIPFEMQKNEYNRLYDAISKHGYCLSTFIKAAINENMNTSCFLDCK